MNMDEEEKERRKWIWCSEYEVHIWLYRDVPKRLGEFNKSYECDTLEEALVEYNRQQFKCQHIMLMHYPDYDKSEDGGDGKVIVEYGVEMIECGNCDETFTIDKGLDIGGIDYCEECYDTISAKDSPVVSE